MDPSSTPPSSDDVSATARRRYESPLRQQQADETRQRIVAAGSELAHGSADWDWNDLTFRTVALRAGVSERTVYRYFPTDRHLREGVMQRLEQEARVSYAEVDLGNLAEVAARVFATLPSFSVKPEVAPENTALVVADERRRMALGRAVEESSPNWSERDRRRVAALLDVLWSVAAHQRMVGPWGLEASEVAGTLSWAIDLVREAIQHDQPPGSPSR